MDKKLQKYILRRLSIISNKRPTYNEIRTRNIKLAADQRQHLDAFFRENVTPIEKIESTALEFFGCELFLDNIPSKSEIRDTVVSLLEKAQKLQFEYGHLDERIEEFIEVAYQRRDKYQFSHSLDDLVSGLSWALSDIDNQLSQGKGHGTTRRARDNFLIPNLAHIFNEHATGVYVISGSKGYEDTVDLDTGEPRAEYLDVACDFVKFILDWLSIPYPSTGDTATRGEAAQGRLRRMVKAALNDPDRKSNSTSS